MSSSGAARLRVGMVGAGMIFDETYRPCFEALHQQPLYRRETGPVEVELAAIASRTGKRAEAYKQAAGNRIADFAVVTEPDGMANLLKLPGGIDVVCVATPDDRHYEAAKAALHAGKHVLIEKPSVLSLSQLDDLVSLAEAQGVLAKVVYHKLLDPDHKRLRTFVADGVLQNVQTGYCTLLEPKSISMKQFAEWVTGRNPGTYVAVHYIKLIDFTFGGRLKTVTATGQRGIVGPVDGPTWDTVQMRMVYEYPDGRQAAHDIHTSWVTPDDFPGYVEQEVQFRFANGVWNGHSRKRGVEVTVEGKTPHTIKNTLNNHYNAPFLEPWGERSQRGYGLEVIRRFLEEVAEVEYGGPAEDRAARLDAIRALAYDDLSADRQVVAAVQALEAVLARAAEGHPDAVVRIEDDGMFLLEPGVAECHELYAGRV